MIENEKPVTRSAMRLLALKNVTLRVTRLKGSVFKRERMIKLRMNSVCPRSLLKCAE